MKKYSFNSIKRGKKPVTLVLAGLLLLVVAVFVGLETSGKTNFFKEDSPHNDQQPVEQTTSDIPSAQPEFSTPESNKDPGNTLGENRGEAVVKDNNGQSVTPTASPVKSATGDIVVYTPTRNSELLSGQTLSGESTLSKVHYRIIDNVSGVIATGSLSVVNGKFSGSISFSTNASEGRIDVFGVTAEAVEFSNIEIPIRFK